MLSELQKLHVEMEDNLRRFADLVDAETPDAAALAAVRWKLSSASRTRTRLVDGDIFPHLLRRASSVEAQRLEQLKRQASAAGNDSSAHITKWTPERVQADWAGYRTASKLMRDRMRQQIRTEKLTLYPLLEPMVAPAPATSVARCA